MANDRITATVKEHRIDIPVDWPDDTEVTIQRLKDDRPSVWEVLAKYDGIATDLPENLAANIDHYVHGHPKK